MLACSSPEPYSRLMWAVCDLSGGLRDKICRGQRFVLPSPPNMDLAAARAAAAAVAARGSAPAVAGASAGAVAAARAAAAVLAARKAAAATSAAAAPAAALLPDAARQAAAAFAAKHSQPTAPSAGAEAARAAAAAFAKRLPTEKQAAHLAGQAALQPGAKAQAPSMGEFVAPPAGGLTPNIGAMAAARLAAQKLAASMSGGGGGGGGGGAAVADGALLALDAECPRGPRAWSGGSPRLAAVLRVAVPPPVNAAMLVELDLALRLEDPPIRANHRVVDADAERKPEPHHHHLGELWPSTISRIRVQCIDPSTQSERVLLHVWSAGPIFLRGRCVGRIVRAAHVVGQRDEDEHGQRRHRIYGDKILTPSRGSLKTLPARVVRTKRGCASQCV